MSRARSLLVILLALLLAAAAAAWWEFGRDRQSRFEAAVGLLPTSTLRVTWTDWTAVRDELKPTVDSPSFDGAAFDADLSSASALASSAEAISGHLGFDLRRVDWEVFGQSKAGAVVIVKLGSQAGPSLTDAWRRLGYAAPRRDPESGGVWQGTDALSAAGALVGTPMVNLALLADRGLLLGSDSANYLADAVKVAQGRVKGLSLGPAGAALADPTAAVVLRGGQACSALAMARGDDGVRQQAEALIEQAGGVAPITTYIAALLPEARIGFVFDHEDSGQARRDLRSRVALATANDPGQMVSYLDLFTIDHAETQETITVLTGSARDASYPLSNTTSGPVLLAAC